MNVAAAVFVVTLLAFTVLGVASAWRRTDTPRDYLVADRKVPAWLAALSAVATNNSGFMFVGLIGFTYAYGVQAVWLQLGWVVGDFLCWVRFHRRVRERSGDLDANGVPTLLATDERGRRDPVIAGAAALLTFFFLAGYAAAQLKAGSTALHALFGWDARVGAILGAVVVVLYSFSGGLRASIWTDAAQSFVMLFAMIALLIAATSRLPLGELFGALRAEDPALVQWMPSEGLAFGFPLYLLGFVFGGLGVLGQPHILVRTMSLDDPANVPKARLIYFAWFVPFSIAAVVVGLYARVVPLELVSEGANVPIGELAMPALASVLLPDVLVGLALAGLFAATISTADSQLLSCSAAVTQDLVPRWRDSYLAGKLATLTVGAFALMLALRADEGVFALVLMAWSALGASLGPLLVLRLAGRPVARPTALAMMAAGVFTVFAWSELGLSGAVFELLPGMAAAFVAYGLAPLLWRPARTEVAP
ncbi:MAG: sodium/proline symporter [Sandaracinus sp.]|nr:sodium/proline symporter [Sandaracinus sp.]